MRITRAAPDKLQLSPSEHLFKYRIASIIINTTHGIQYIMNSFPKSAPSWELVATMLRYSGTCHRDVSASTALNVAAVKHLQKELDDWQKEMGYWGSPKCKRATIIEKALLEQSHE